MKKLFATIASMIFCAALYAQNSPAELSVSLQRAIDLGLQNRFDIQSDKYVLLRAENEINKSKMEWIPEIAGNGNVRYSPKIQSTFIPAGFFGDDAALVSLGAKSTSVFGLDLTQTIYKPGISSDIKIARNQLALEKQKNRQNENLIKERIAEAYLNVMLRDLQTRIASADEQRYNEYAQVAEGKLKLGSLLENDYLKAKLDYENSKVETLKARQNYALALDNIRYQMNIPAETKLILTDSLSSAATLFDQLPVQYTDGSRTEIEQLRLQQQNNLLQISKSRQNALPTVSFYANYSQQFQYNNFDYSLGKWWSPFNYLGLRLSIPITANFKNSSTVRAQQLSSSQTDLLLKQKIADVDFEIKRSRSELGNALQNMNTAKNNYDLSRVIYENQKQQYNLGALLYSDLLDTDRSLNTTEQNYVKAVYDYLVASINFQKAIGNY